MTAAVLELPAQTEAAAAPTRHGASGDVVLDVAKRHVGEPYALGARAPMANSDWTGPWDCAEFASWCVYRAVGILYGTRPADDPVMADAYTGYWAQQAALDGADIPVEDALRIAGACLLRRPGNGPLGHIALSTGDGGTIEAHSSSTGVIAHTARNRRWDCGVLVPGVRYYVNERTIRYAPPARVLRITTPLTRGGTVLR
ncbi:MAG: CHAP domain-containing protein, partial [Gammaproteobacteria bacterium]|nr:CHAP domain-containing protein [Gammaproteobacteria bacterium]